MRYKIFNGILRQLDKMAERGQLLSYLHRANMQAVADEAAALQYCGLFQIGSWITSGRRAVFPEPNVLEAMRGATIDSMPMPACARDGIQISWPMSCKHPAVIVRTGICRELLPDGAYVAHDADMPIVQVVEPNGMSHMLFEAQWLREQADMNCQYPVIHDALRVLAYMEALPGEIHDGLPKGVRLRHLRGQTLKATHLTTPRDIKGHFRIGHFRRYPIRPDGTRRQGRVFVRSCVVGTDVDSSTIRDPGRGAA